MSNPSSRSSRSRASRSSSSSVAAATSVDPASSVPSSSSPIAPLAVLPPDFVANLSAAMQPMLADMIKSSLAFHAAASAAALAAPPDLAAASTSTSTSTSAALGSPPAVPATSYASVAAGTAPPAAPVPAVETKSFDLSKGPSLPNFDPLVDSVHDFLHDFEKLTALSEAWTAHRRAIVACFCVVKRLAVACGPVDLMGYCTGVQDPLSEVARTIARSERPRYKHGECCILLGTYLASIHAGVRGGITVGERIREG